MFRQLIEPSVTQLFAGLCFLAGAMIGYMMRCEDD
jgi:hypothetical protein